MSNVQPLVPGVPDEPRLASVTHLGSALGDRDDWLAAVDGAWRQRRNDPAGFGGLLREVRAIRVAAERVGDEFVVAAADVTLLYQVAEQERFPEAVAGLVPAAADLETYPASTWLGRAHGVLGTVFARLDEIDQAREHFTIEREVGEAIEDLALQAEAVLDLARIVPPGPDALEAYSTAEILFTRASVDQDRLGLGRLEARLDRAVTTLRLGLVAGALEQLPAVVELARSLDRPVEEALALALLGRCTAASGDIEGGMTTTMKACDLAQSLPGVRRPAALVECARAFVACKRPDLAAALLDDADLRGERDLAVRAEVLGTLAESYERLGRREQAFRVLREADRLQQERLDGDCRSRLDTLRAYHRSRSAERELSTQRELSTRLLEQVAGLGETTTGVSELAIRDEVTGLPNRRYLDLELRWRCSQRLPGRSLLGLVMVSVDDFDGIVAHAGDESADRLAAIVGQIVRANVRAGDAVARYGESMFAVIQFHRSVEAARFAGERLRAAVAAYPWSEQRFGRDVTASVGIAALHPPTTPGALVGRATGAVGQAGAEGGDRVHVAGV